MSTTPTTSSTSAPSSGYQLTSLSNGSALQVTGLASGLNTDQIVQQLMAIQSQPLTHMQNQQTTLQDQVTELQAIQTALQKVASDAQALNNPSLFANTQTITSTNPTLVSAAATSSGAGAVVGGYQVAVTALATSAQETYSFTSPTAADTVTIDGQQLSLAAGASVNDLVNAVNNNTSLDVWATATDSGTIVFSDRATGLQSGSSYFSVSDTTGSVFQTLAQQGQNYPGQNAAYSINNGTSQSSPSNTVTTAIPGVTLTFNGVTPSGSAVAVDVGAPAPSSSAVQTALQSFITDYNSAIGLIQAQLAQQPSSSDLSQGTLFGDVQLSNMLSSLRQALYANQPGAPSALNNLLDIGVSTGSTTGGGTPAQSAIAGDLTLNSSTLTSALQSNPSNVQQLLQSFSQSFSSLVNNQAAPGGVLDSWIQGDDSEVSRLGTQISNMQSALSVKENALIQQFAQMEAALSQNQSTSNWLTSQIASLP